MVQPGGDEGVDELFSIWKSDAWMKFGTVPEVKKVCLAKVVYVSW